MKIRSAGGQVTGQQYGRLGGIGGNGHDRVLQMEMSDVLIEKAPAGNGRG